MKAVLTLTLAVLVAIGAGIGIEGATGQTGNVAVLTSFQRAAAEHSEHVVLSEVVSIPGSASTTITVSGDERTGDGGTEANLTTQIGATNVKELLTPDGVFVDTSAAKLPGGATWIEISTAELARELGVTDAASLFSGASGDPSQMLGLLAASSQSGVTEVGTSVLDGVPVTEYDVAIDLQTAAAHAGAAYEQLLKSLRRYLTSSTLDVSVWIDAQGLPRQVTYDAGESITVNGQTVQPTVQVTMDLSQFGVPVEVSDPAPGTVYQLPASLVRPLASQLGSV